MRTFLGSFTKRLDDGRNQRKAEGFLKIFSILKTIAVIAAGSLIYAVALHFFIFPHNVLLGGTGGVSVLLNRFFPQLSPETYLVIINASLMVVALLTLGKNMVGKTMLGSLLTTAFTGMMDSIPTACLADCNVFLSAIIGSVIVAIGSAVLFYIDSSSGGTDIIALIIKKYARVSIGKALLVADVLIVVVGILSFPWQVAVASVIGLLIKTFGIDLLIQGYRKLLKRNVP